MMPGMTDLQNILVADRQADLARDGAALRAERQRDHLREHAANATEAFDHPADLPPRRVRVGRWLVAVGQAIAGTRGPASDAPPAMAASASSGDDPCGDGRDRDRDRLAPAA